MYMYTCSVLNYTVWCKSIQGENRCFWTVCECFPYEFLGGVISITHVRSGIPRKFPIHEIFHPGMFSFCSRPQFSIKYSRYLYIDVEYMYMELQ